MLCWYRGIIASMVLVVGLLSVPTLATPDWMERPGTINHALQQQDGSHVYLDAVLVAKNMPYQNPPYFVVRDSFDRMSLLIILTTPPSELRPWQTVDVEGTLSTLPSGDRALVDVKVFGYLDKDSNLLYHGPLIKGLLRPIPWDWMTDLTVYSSNRSSTLEEDDLPSGEPDPNPLPAATEVSTIASAKLGADNTFITLTCKRIDQTAHTGYFTITEDSNYNDTLNVYYSGTVDTTNRLNTVTGTMKTFNGERILCVDSGPGSVFSLAVDQMGSARTAALGTIAYVKTLPNGTLLAANLLPGKVVTAIFNTSPTPFFYIQEPTGSGHEYNGIKVVPGTSTTINGLSIGELVDIEGTVYGAPGYPECYIQASSIDQSNVIVPLPRPAGMSNKSTVGGSFGLQSALYSDVATNPMKMGAGLNPVGILVKAWGTFYTGAVDGNTIYYLDDGSHLLGSVSSTAHSGLGLWYVPNTSTPVWVSESQLEPQFVATTGVLGAEWSDLASHVPVPVLRLDSTAPVIQVTDDGDQTAIATQLHFSWNVIDDESGITDCQYAIGTSPTDPVTGYTVGWKSASSVGEATETVALSPSTTYYVYIRAINGTGLAAIGVSDGITVDTNAPRIGSITDNINQYSECLVPQYEKYEAAFTIQTEGETTPGSKVFANDSYGYNPFSPRLDAYDISSPHAWDGWPGIYIDAIITKPDGTVIRWPCFYDYSRGWKFRFAPTSTGAWSYKIEVRYKSSSGSMTYLVKSPSKSFTCSVNTSGSSRRGFLTVDANDHRFFSFSNGDVFYPMGVLVIDTDDIASLGSNGGNWTRVLNTSNLFEQYSEYPDYVNNFQEAKALTWDTYFNTCQNYGVYVLWAINDWTRWKSISTTTDGYSLGYNSADSTTIRTPFCSGAPQKGWLVISSTVRLHYRSRQEYYGSDNSTHSDDWSIFTLYTSQPHAAFLDNETVVATENPYIADGVATDVHNTFTNAQTREVYKRKLRWMMARYGYSTNLVGFDLINECQENNSGARQFHYDMAAFVRGDITTDYGGQVGNTVPGSWPVWSNDFAELPHLITGDQTSCEYRAVSIPWNDDRIGMTNYHDYAGSGEGWSGIRTDQGPDEYDQLGCNWSKPWVDATVWADRMAREHRECNYSKPLCWSEYGLSGANHTGDWNDAYFGNASIPGDLSGRHAKDWYWGLIFNAIFGNHWHPQFFTGNCDSSRPGYHVTHWDLFKPLANFLFRQPGTGSDDVDMRGMTQESYYPPPYTISLPHFLSSDIDVGAYGLYSSNRAYLYVKNLTSTWYYYAGFRDQSVPTPISKSNVTITVRGLAPGYHYIIEKWSTTDPTLGAQMKSSDLFPAAGEPPLAQGQDLTFTVNLGTDTDYDWAYSIHQ